MFPTLKEVISGLITTMYINDNIEIPKTDNFFIV